MTIDLRATVEQEVQDILKTKFQSEAETRFFYRGSNSGNWESYPTEVKKFDVSIVLKDSVSPGVGVYTISSGPMEATCRYVVTSRNPEGRGTTTSAGEKFNQKKAREKGELREQTYIGNVIIIDARLELDSLTMIVDEPPIVHIEER